MSQKRTSSPICSDEKIKSAKLENIIKSSIFESCVKEKLSKAIREGVDFNSDCGLHLYNEPFPCFVIKDFLSDTNFVHKLKNELSELNFFEKSNDLFKFQQSNDLVDGTSKYMVAFREFLFTTFRQWLEEVMEISLESTVDMSCAKYEYTDVLLCHDDELEGRRIAFIYYLPPEGWDEKDGGSLDMFSVDEDGHPDNIVRSTTPTFNSFAFFEVSEKSFHQVAEVVSKSKTRMSISGWFHGESLRRKTPKPIKNMLPEPVQHMEDELLLSWINPMYLNPEIVVDIEEQFEDNSEIQLKDFLLDNKYKDLLAELTNKDISWIRKGPVNKRLYWTLPPDTSASTVYQFLQLIKSMPFFKLLSKFTGLDLAILEESENEDEKEAQEFHVPPSCVAEVRQWKHGCYTLLHDQDYCGGEYVLDALFHLSCDDWDDSLDAGYTSYIANDEGNELMRVDPTSNCLSLVYRDEETARFVKYYNHKLSERCKQYFDISAVYFEGTKK